MDLQSSGLGLFKVVPQKEEARIIGFNHDGTLSRVGSVIVFCKSLELLFLFHPSPCSPLIALSLCAWRTAQTIYRLLFLRVQSSLLTVRVTNPQRAIKTFFKLQISVPDDGVVLVMVVTKRKEDDTIV